MHKPHCMARPIAYTWAVCNLLFKARAHLKTCIYKILLCKRIIVKFYQNNTILHEIIEKQIFVSTKFMLKKSQDDNLKHVAYNNILKQFFKLLIMFSLKYNYLGKILKHKIVLLLVNTEKYVKFTSKNLIWCSWNIYFLKVIEKITFL